MTAPKKQLVNFKVAPSVVKAFDAWAKKVGYADRTAALVAYMTDAPKVPSSDAIKALAEAVSATFAPVEIPALVPRASQTDQCPHPKDQRTVASWGSICQVCGNRVS